MISGPSGVGKGTVCARLRTVHPEAFYSVSMTTRPARQGEVDGVHYHFVDADEFRRLIERGELLEWAVVHGTNYYGTPKAPVDAALSDGRCVVLEIDLQGARQVRRTMPEALFVFLAPPSWEELVRRLVGRGTEDEAEREARLATAKVEIASASEFDTVIVNEDVQQASEDLVSLMGASSSTAPLT